MGTCRIMTTEYRLPTSAGLLCCWQLRNPNPGSVERRGRALHSSVGGRCFLSLFLLNPTCLCRCEPPQQHLAFQIQSVLCSEKPFLSQIPSASKYSSVFHSDSKFRKGEGSLCLLGHLPSPGQQEHTSHYVCILQKP